MRVRYLGFAVEGDGVVGLPQLASYLQQKKAPYGGQELIIRMGERDGYYVGLIVAVKDQQQVFELETEDLVIEVRELEEGRAVVDFNFFVINKATGRGLYQYYFHSLGIRKFGTFLKRQLRDLVRQESDKEIAARDLNGGLTDRQRSMIRRMFKSSIEVTQLVRQEDLPDLIKEMSKVKRFRYEVGALKAQEAPLFRPEFKNLVSVTKTEFVFDREKSPEKVKSALLAVVKLLSGTRGKIVGVDDDGAEQTLSLLDNYEKFGEVEMGQAAKTMNLKVADFQKSAMIKALLEAAKKHAVIFEEA